MKKILVPIALLIVFIVLFKTLPNFTQKHQFEDYSWGMPMSEALQLIKAKSKAIYKIDEMYISYRDKIANNDCCVVLYFTQKDKLLSMITILWYDKNLLNILKNMLTDKYGNPRKYEIIGVSHYGWGNKIRGEIDLSYKKEDYEEWSSELTKLTYLYGNYSKKLFEELPKTFSEDKDRF